ncbi:MAG: flavin reductase, partial [Clostridia bacterium]|nr:flavin reductase [Clostridia bacterium]
ITAGDKAGFNTMTASWGGMGVLWGRDVAFCFIRPQRYTYQFVQKQPRFTLSFYGDGQREALNLCGTRSGRDLDKAKAAGLTPVFEGGAVWFDEAKLVLVCQKLYDQDIDPSNFLDAGIAQHYAQKDYHRMYIGGIERVLVKE